MMTMSSVKSCHLKDHFTGLSVSLLCNNLDNYISCFLFTLDSIYL